jgi:hypothetical protein
MALNMAEDMIQIKDKHDNPVMTKRQDTKNDEDNDNDDGVVVEEVLTSEIKAIVEE